MILDHRIKYLACILAVAPSLVLATAGLAQSGGGIDIKDPALRRQYLKINSVGNAAVSRRDFKQAIAQYGEMIKLAPRVMDGYLLRGMAYYRLNDMDHAIADDTTAIRLDRIPRRRAATEYNRGKCYLAKRDYDRAIADFTRALQDGGPDTDTYEERGNAYFGKHSFKEAVADFTRAYERDPRHTLAISGRAQSYLALHDYPRAVADYERFARAEAGHVESWGALAWAQYLDGKLTEAIANNKKALAMNPRLTFARFNLALCYATKGNWEPARKEYEAVLQIAPREEAKLALRDVRDALKRRPVPPALKQAEALLAKSASP